MSRRPPAPIPPGEGERHLRSLLDTAARLRRRPVPPGSLRGIDYYDDHTLSLAMARSLARFFSCHGRWPALAPPVSYNDKLYCAKFFMPMPMPSLADKRHVAEVIPPAFQGRVRPLPIAWSAPLANLPGDEALAAGPWWMKANHGSGMNLLLDWPPTAAVRADAEILGARWLQTDYGAAAGEWWYATVPRSLMLVQDIGADGQSFDCKFAMIHGRIRYLLVAFDLPDGQRARVFHDPLAATRGDWQPLAIQLQASPTPPVPPPAALSTMCDFACAVGAGFEQVRVDLLHAPDGTVHLTELTFCDMDARARFTPPSFDAALGATWDVSAWYP